MNRHFDTSRSRQPGPLVGHVVLCDPCIGELHLETYSEHQLLFARCERCGTNLDDQRVKAVPAAVRQRLEEDPG